MELTLILGTGRTGSMFLKRHAFGRRPDLFTVVESKFREESLRYLQWKHGAKRKSPLRRALPLPALYRSKYAWSRRKASRSSGAPRVVDVNNYLFPLLPEVLKAFPEAKLVHVIRDPRTFMVSGMNRGWFLSHHGDRMRAPDLAETSRREWKAWPPHRQLAWYWMRANQMILEARPVVTIRYEDLFAPGYPGFRALVDVVAGSDWDWERDVDFQTKNAARGSYVRRWEDWLPEWKADARAIFEQAEELFEVSRWYPDLLDDPSWSAVSPMADEETARRRAP